MRKPGLNFKLEESWEGPFVITKRNSTVSYGASVHIQLLKKYVRSEENMKVGRATSVLNQIALRTT